MKEKNQVNRMSRVRVKTRFEHVKVKVPPKPYEPMKEERQSHEATHCPFRAWCEICVKAKSPDGKHVKQVGNPEHIPVIEFDFIFLESFIKWFADCSHCNQEGPFPTKKTCLVSMIWSHLQQTVRVDQTCYWCCRWRCRLLSTTASCSSRQLQVNWISSARILSFRPRHSVDCDSCSATTFILYVINKCVDDAC